MATVYGTVGAYDPELGGFALGQDGSGRKYRFAAPDLVDGVAPVVGVHVAFEPVRRSRYWRAARVRRVVPAPSAPVAGPRAVLSEGLLERLDRALRRWTR
jgi:hypothetical protein